jgi:predicted Zn-ribbon and HTH transcriptional regulator
MNKCEHCGYRFEDAESLRRHLEEGSGCPELGDA